MTYKLAYSCALIGYFLAKNVIPNPVRRKTVKNVQRLFISYLLALEDQNYDKEVPVLNNFSSQIELNYVTFPFTLVKDWLQHRCGDLLTLRFIRFVFVIERSK